MNPKQDQARIDRIISEIRHSMKQPGWKPQTSNQLRASANRKRDMANTVRLTGGEVKQEFL